MRVLVTGGTGFIGRHLVRRLLATHTPDSIVCLVAPSVTAREAIAQQELREAGVRLVEGDLNLPTVSRERLPQVDLVFHLAAKSDTDAPEEDLRLNDLGCTHLLQWLGEAARGARLMYTSSIAVQDRNHPADGPITELSPCVPRTAYGITKLRGEQIIRDSASGVGYTFTICRLATVYGPGAKPGGLFDRLFTLTRAHQLLGRLNWPGRTSIMNVDDVTGVLVGLANRSEAAGETYCVANPEAPTVGSIAQQINRLAPQPAPTITLPNWFWRVGRSIAWSRACQSVLSAVASTTLWRLTLILDDGFWFDTTKLQGVWNQAPKDLVEGLLEMLKYL